MRMGLLSKVFKNGIVKNAIIYVGTDSINKAIPFILLPIVALYLSPADYGKLSNFSVLIQIFTAIIGLNTYTALSVSYHRIDNIKLSQYLSNLVYLIVFICLVCLIFIFGLKNVIYQYISISYLWQNLAIVTATSSALVTLYTSLLRMEEKAFKFGGINIFQSINVAVFALCFVVLLKWGWQGRALSISLPSLLTMLLCVLMLLKSKRLFKRVNIREMKDAFYFGLPLLPHTLSFWFKSGMDKIFITNQIGLSANGVFSIAATLSAIVGVFTGAFFNAYTPKMFKELSLIDKSDEREAELIKKKLVKITYIFSIVLLVLCVFGYLLMRYIIPLLFKGDYIKAVDYMPFLLTTTYFEGMYSIISGYIFYRKKTKILGTITFSSSIMQMLLTYTFLQYFGIMGALYSGAIVSILTFMVVLGYTNKIYDLPWRFRRRPSLKAAI